MNRTLVTLVALLGLGGVDPCCGSPPIPSPDDVREQFDEFASRYPDLVSPVDSREFRHPGEIDMIDTLMTKNPGIQSLVDKTKEEQARFVKERDKLYELSSILVGPAQHPDIHVIAVDSARELGLGDDFKVFIMNDPGLNGNVFGIPTHGHYGNSFSAFTILLTSGLIRGSTPEELRFVISREMGHVKANHRFYTALAFNYQAETGKMPRLEPEEQAKDAPGLGGALLLFFDRGPFARRLSEYSADRAGLVGVREPKVALRMLAKYAAGDLQDRPGFNLDEYVERQLEHVLRDLTPKDVEYLTRSEGFSPFILNRVGELNRFAKSQDFQRLVDRATMNPFLMEVETLYKIGFAMRYYGQKLERYREDPKRNRINPLAREQVERDLSQRIESRRGASADLTEIIGEQINKVGLEASNPYFEELITTIEVRKDAGPFASLLAALAENIRFALQRPGLPDDEREVLEAKQAAIEEVKDLAPADHDASSGQDAEWLEASDLPEFINIAMGRLQAAGAEGKSEFLDTLAAMRPEFKTVGIRLLGNLDQEDKISLANLVSGYGGKLSDMVTDVLAAGNDDAAAEEVMDRYFDHAMGWLETMPAFLIRLGLKRFAKTKF